MENFIIGYPSREFQIREELLKVLGKEKYDLFFDSVSLSTLTCLTQFLTNFFTASDAQFLRDYGMNALRVPFSYSRFLFEKKQLYPFNINKEGLRYIDRVVKICQYGFPGLRYVSTPAYLERSFERKCTFKREHGLPIWNGEFRPMYDSKGPEKGMINRERYQMLKD